MEPQLIQTNIGDDVASTRSRCRVCDNADGNRMLVAEERMFDTRERFTYLHCARCGLLQLQDVPDDMARFYSGDRYYSLAGKATGLRRWAMNLRDTAYVRPGLLANWLANRFPQPAIQAMTEAAPARDTRILDVGCGNGSLLLALERLGYTRLVGVDPFLAQSQQSGCVRLVAGPLADAPSEQDLVCFHHSFEHVTDPQAALRSAAAKLAPRGRILIRVPNAASLAFEAYGADWVQWDAPRHIVLHTPASLRMLAAQVGLKLQSLAFDSQPFQFWASDAYRAGVPFLSQQARPWRRRRQRFYRELSHYVNEHGRGDQIVAVMGLA